MQRIPFAIVLAFAFAFAAAGARAGVLAPSKPSQIVTLYAQGHPCPVGGDGAVFNLRVLPDGTGEWFSIPEGHVLVITGMSFRLHGGFNDAEAKSLQVLIVKDASTVAPIFFSSVLAGSTGTGRTGGDTVTIPNVVVAPGMSLCAFASDSNGSPVGLIALLYGFFERDR